MAYSPWASGIGNTAAYQVAGRPFLTGSTVEDGNGSGASQEIKISFPHVCRSFQVVNTGSAPIKIHFASQVESPALVDEKTYFLLPSDMTHAGSGSVTNYISGSYRNQPFTMDIKCVDLYISSAGMGQSGFQLAAELTHIPQNDMYVLSGSGINAERTY